MIRDLLIFDCLARTFGEPMAFVVIGAASACYARGLAAARPPQNESPLNAKLRALGLWAAEERARLVALEASRGDSRGEKS